jgi:hypothetical protein
MLELKWTHVEKVVARKAFDQALHRELCEVIRRTKEMAGAASERPIFELGELVEGAPSGD